MQMLSSQLSPSTLSQDVYTDLSGLSRLRKQAQDDPEKTLKAVAQQFEALFMQMVLKSMRDASFGDPVFDSSQSEFYQDMFDKQLTLNMTQGRGMGMAEALERQMRGQIQMPVLDNALSATNDTEKTKSTEFIMPVLRAVSLRSQKPQTDKDVTMNTGENISFSSPEVFVRQLLPLAREAADKLGVDAEVLLAQAALETGWGKHISQHADGSSSNNLFNIKASHDWEGGRVAIRTLEYRDGVAKHERAAFRAYDSFADSFNDYVDFLKSRPRYQSALEQAGDAESFIRELHGAGYATDPNYADKILNIMQRPTLQTAMENGNQYAG
ncbi:Flagellar protein FlgJ [peptidoglycan hydrolase] [hydrothermal vent metagenome]|uniref:Peptidoglycan hydrolase FlgJ n=1 Tax=hydrothermal vent metagenome TaxID=652676 RepID=A0A3B1BGQ1_9ZZZZ